MTLLLSQAFDKAAKLPETMQEQIAASHIKILRARMVHHNRGSRLLGHELKLFGERHADARGIEQAEELGLIFEIRACGIAEGIARAAFVPEQRIAVASRLFFSRFMSSNQ